jgi:hypothetical protein
VTANLAAPPTITLQINIDTTDTFKLDRRMVFIGLYLANGTLCQKSDASTLLFCPKDKQDVVQSWFDNRGTGSQYQWRTSSIFVTDGQIPDHRSGRL